MREISLKLDAVAPVMPGGDVLLWRAGCRPFSWLIARTDDTIYSHGGGVAWCDPRRPRPSRFTSYPMCGRELYLLDTLQFHGGRALSLSNEVARHPGRWDWYHVCRRGYDRDLAVAKMSGIVGKRYGWWSLCRAAVRNTHLARWLVPPALDDTANGHLPYCTQALSAWMRAGGVDPVINSPDRVTTPGRIARSAVLAYQGTLY